MTPADLLQFPEPDAAEIEAPLEPEPEIELEPELEPEPESGPEQPTPAAPAALASTALVEILPADFPLPALIKFLPNPALRADADKAAAYALSVAIDGPEGVQRGDLALSALRTSLKAIEEHFKEPVSVANDLHKRLTAIRGEWTERGAAAVRTLGSRIYTEQRRLDDLEAEERRKAQAEADRLAREALKREAAAAEQQQAPAPIVEELKRQAETATAPPVSSPAAAPAPMRSSTTVTTWKARITGTPGSDEPNPAMADLSIPQRAHVMNLMRAVLDGKAPLTCFELNWSVMNGRAKAEKSALAIPGIEAVEIGSVRAKISRTR